MQKKFTKSTRNSKENSNGTPSTGKKAAFWRSFLLPSLPKLMLFTFLAVLFLFPIGLFAKPLFRTVALLFSVYVLLSLCLRAPRLCRAAWQRLALRLHRLEWAELWTRITLMGGLLLNLGYAVFRTVYGLFAHSLWFCAEGAYYMGLSTARFLVVEIDHTGTHTATAKSYLLGGRLLLILSLSAIGTVTLAIGARPTASYPDAVIWLSALFALWRVVSALFQLFRFHRRRRAVPLLAKAISLSAAAVSLFGLQTTLLTRFGHAAPLATRWNTVSGTIICFSLPVMALFIIKRGRDMLKGR